MNGTEVTPQAIEAEGQRLFAQEMYHEAAERFSTAQRAYVEAGDELKAAEMLNNVGVVYRRAGQHKEAANFLEEARQAFERLGDRERQAQTLGNLGGLYSKMKRYDESEACFQEAVELFGEWDDRVRQSETLRAMAIMQFKRRQFTAAVNTYQDALYFLPNLSFLQRLARFFFRISAWILSRSPFR